MQSLTELDADRAQMRALSAWTGEPIPTGWRFWLWLSVEAAYWGSGIGLFVGLLYAAQVYEVVKGWLS